jgi:hypothetical protein
MDGGLISEKQRGLSAKSAKTGQRVDFKETRGLLCKIPENIDLRIIFQRVRCGPGPRVVNRLGALSPPWTDGGVD